MHSMLLTSDKDPMGAAIIDYLAHGKASKLRVFSSMFDEDEIPVNQLFRTFQEMPSLEQKALQLSTGKILDVGAGSGCHTLALQEMGKEVTAIDNVLKNALVILIAFQGSKLSPIDPKLMVNACAGIFILPFFLFSSTRCQRRR